MEFKGTKGKWHIYHNGQGYNSFSINSKYKVVPIEEMEANALLISKAPCFYEELKETIIDLKILRNQIDHINQDKLDNRKVNLRICTHQQNQFNKTKQSNNTSGYKGVTCLSNNRFMAQIKKGDYKISKNFNNIIDAAIWYNSKAKELFGEFAYLNEIENQKG